MSWPGNDAAQRGNLASFCGVTRRREGRKKRNLPHVTSTSQFPAGSRADPPGFPVTSHQPGRSGAQRRVGRGGVRGAAQTLRRWYSVAEPGRPHKRANIQTNARASRCQSTKKHSGSQRTSSSGSLGSASAPPGPQHTEHPLPRGETSRERLQTTEKCPLLRHPNPNANLRIRLPPRAGRHKLPSAGVCASTTARRPLGRSLGLY